MKKIILAFMLLVGAIIYLIARISVKTLSLSDISMESSNPVSFDGLNIGINTNLVANSPQSIYYISLIPIYLLVVLAIFFLMWGLKKDSK